MIFSSHSTILLNATGIPLGLLKDTEYESSTARIQPEDTLLMYTDGLTDSIAGGNAEIVLRRALAVSGECVMPNLKALVDPKLNEDDVTICC